MPDKNDDLGTLEEAIRNKFPNDSQQSITAWVDVAIEYGQPLTLVEYSEYRMYTDSGNLKCT